MKKAVTEDEEEFAIVEFSEDDWRLVRMLLDREHTRISKLMDEIDAHLSELYDP
jgi:hypothetical protein